jgi:hypothetical protein
MATTHLTEAEAQNLAVPDLIRRARAGEEILIEGEEGAVLVRMPDEPELDPSVEATLARVRKSAEERGYPLRMGADFADDVDKIIAMRKPGHGDPWASSWT